ncbi:MAG: hypothetical protein R3F14_05140 [Polyangiaceae bacterium]
MGLSLEETTGKLGEATGKVSALSASLEEREKALREYKERARQLEAIKARFEALKRKLDQLTKLGLAVTIRNNRMVISLPGDVLFDSGADLALQGWAGDPGGGGHHRSRSVADLAQLPGGGAHRQQAVPRGGLVQGQLGPVADARGVLLHLVDKGGMPRDKWSAAGFADTDPIAPNDDDAGRQKNRRCDLIVVPSVEEMLDLKSLAN